MLIRSRPWRVTVWSLVFVMLLSLTTGGSPVSASSPDAANGFEMVGQIGGVTRAVAAQGGYAYVAAGLRLLVQQVTANGMALTIGSSRPFSHFALGVAVSGHYAYVAAGSAGLRIIDVSNPENPIEVGAWDSPGYAEAVVVDGGTAYVADGPYGLQIVDVTNPTSPERIGSSFTNNYAYDVAVENGRACVASAGAGLLVADVANPHKPSELAVLDTTGYAYGVALRAGIAYVADGWEGMQVISVADPGHPATIGTCKPTGWVLDVAVSQKGYAYLAAAYGGVRVIDVHDPARPREAAAVEVTDMNPDPAEAGQAPGHVGSVALDGDRLYAVERKSGVFAVDVASPTAPRRPGAATLSDVTGLACEGAVTRLFGLGVISGRPDGTFGPKLTVTRAELAKMLIVAIGAPVIQVSATSFKDVSAGDWAAPYVVAASSAGIINGYPDGTFKPNQIVRGDEAITMALRAIKQRPTSGVALEDYVALGNRLGLTSGIGITPGIGLDRGKTAMLVDRMFYDIPGGSDGRTLAETRHALSIEGKLGWADSVAVQGHYAYVAAGACGFAIIDISDPSRPVQVGSYAINSFSTAVTIASGYAYVASNSGPEGGLHVFDISNPARPRRIYLYQSHEIGAYQDLTIDRDRAYLADERGLEILTLSNPARPSRLGRIDLWDSQKYSTCGVAASGDYAYVVANAGGLFVINVADPANPRTVARYNGQSYGPTRVSLAGNLLYLLGTNMAEAVDVTDPANPRRTTCLVLPNESFGGVEATADGVYLAGGVYGLTLVKNDTAALTLVASFNTLGAALDVDSDSGLIAIADGQDGLLVLRNGQSVASADKKPTGQYQDTITDSGLAATFAEAQTATDRGPAISADLQSPAVRPATVRRVVTSTADSGVGTLRSYLQDAKPGLTITFDPKVFPPDKPAIIAVQSALPEIRCGFVTIDGRGTGVIIDGGSLRANGQSPQCGLLISSGWNVIKGIEVRNFPDHGIFMANGWCNTVGGPLPGEGNVTYGNGWHGICMLMQRAFGNVVVGNYCGTDRAGTTGPGNRGHGISMEMGAWGNLIQGNLCSGNDRVGINIGDDGSNFNTIVGNIVGTDVTGTKALPNNEAGICASYFGSSFNRIGGTAPGESNLISGNRTGVTMGGPGSEGILVLGNRFGATLGGTGTVSLKGYQCAIQTGSVTHTMIGGASSAEGNIIVQSGGGDGMTIDGDFNFVLGNRITLGADSDPGSIGMFTDGEHNWLQGNVIDGDLGQGVQIGAGDWNTIRRNLISGCRFQAIDLRDGGNGGVRSPVIRRVSADRVEGTAEPGALVEVYSVGADKAVFFEGEALTDASGNFAFQSSGPFRGTKVMCTGTDGRGNTSAMSGE